MGIFDRADAFLDNLWVASPGGVVQRGISHPAGRELLQMSSPIGMAQRALPVIRDHVDPLARSLSLITPATRENGERYWAPHVPGTFGGTRDPETGVITDGQSVGESVRGAADVVTDVVAETTRDVGGAAADVAGATVRAAMPLVIVAAIAYVVAQKGKGSRS